MNAGHGNIQGRMGERRVGLATCETIAMVPIWVFFPIIWELGTSPWKGDPIAYKGALATPVDSIEFFCTRSHFSVPLVIC